MLWQTIKASSLKAFPSAATFNSKKYFPTSIKIIKALESNKPFNLCYFSTMDQKEDLPELAPKVQTIIEGTARMEYDARETVFYNKVQVLNRDLSIQVIKLFAEKYLSEKQEKYESKHQAFKIASQKMEGSNETSVLRPPLLPPKGIRVLDALAASGLRSIRYLKEVPLIEHVTINDLSSDATDLAKANCILNGVDSSRVSVSNLDACMAMYSVINDAKKHYDVIDLDPYGTAVPFLDAAVQAVAHGGLLCVTCTDMTVLSGNFPEVCYAKYHSMPVRGKYLHEMSLRMLLHSIDSTANKYKRYIVPWLSLSVDFYVRVFVRVFESPAEVKMSSTKRAMVYQSLQCPTFYLHTVGASNKNKSNFSANALETPHTCEETGGRLKLGGPIWSDSIHDQKVIDELLVRMKQATAEPDENMPVATSKRLTGILTTMSEELKDVVLYYSLPELASAVQCKCPTFEEFKAALNNGNYRVSQFHHDASAVKTDAPNQFVWDIMRAYVKRIKDAGEEPTRTKAKLSAAAISILSKPITSNIDFTVKEFRPRDRTVARFPMNPDVNWGPKRKAGRLVKEQTNSLNNIEESALNIETEEMPLEKRSKMDNNNNNDDDMIEEK